MTKRPLTFLIIIAVVIYLLDTRSVAEVRLLCDGNESVVFKESRLFGDHYLMQDGRMFKSLPSHCEELHRNGL